TVPLALLTIALGAGWPTPGVATTRCESLAARVAAAEQGIGVLPSAARQFARLSRSYASRCVHLNETQVRGTPNSYHIRPLEPPWSALLAFTSCFNQLDYTHVPLDAQLSTQGIRQIELDVWADPAGGLYANRNVLVRVGQPTASGVAELDEP